MKFFVIFLVVSFTSLPVLGQYEMSGQILDKKGDPLPGVNVSLKDSYDGSSTDADGRFNFTTKITGKQVILASYIGYKPSEIEVEIDGNLTNIIIDLEEQINKLDGVTISAGAFEASDKKKSVILKTFDIVTTAGATADLTGVMNTLPSTQTGGEEGRLFVRGGARQVFLTLKSGLIAEFYLRIALFQ